MFWIIAFVLFVHAFAHLPGFVVPWQLMTSPEMPYKTTVLAGHLNVGDTGIRIIGLLWLAVGLLLVAAAAAWASKSSWAPTLTAVAAVVSLAICLVEVPQAKIGVGVNVALLLATPLLGGLAWHATTDRVLGGLQPSRTAAVGAGHPGVMPATPAAGELPASVARYLARALPSDQRPIAMAVLEQQAEFFVGGEWKPLTATQTFVAEPPGFVWDATIVMMPGLPVFVRDSYIGGRGSMHGEFAGVFPLVRQSGRPELDAGALHRYVAESVWLPTALRPGPHLRWTAIDDRNALATFSDRHTTVQLQFRFNADGDVEEIHVPDRAREENGRYVPTPWTVRCEEYATVQGIRIPVRCEVAWQMPGGPAPYWRGRITKADYRY